MPATETITFPVESSLLAKWKASAKEYGYASVNAMLEDAIIRDMVKESDEPDLAYWLEKEISRRCHESDAAGGNLSGGEIRLSVMKERAE